MTGPGRRALWLGTLLLVALPLSPLLRAPWNALTLAAVGALWLWTARRALIAPPGDELAGRARRGGLILVAACLLAAAALSLFAPWVIERATAERSEEAVAEALQQRWTGLWNTLDAEARRAAADLEVPATKDSERLQAFETLERLVGPAPAEGDEAAPGRPTLLLVDPDGEAVAWAGEGLLNEPEPSEILPEGFDVSASFGSATLLAVQPLGEGRRPWRVIAGRSFPTSKLPFGLPLAARLHLGGEAVRWSVARPGTPLSPGARTVAPEGVPTLVWLPPETRRETPWPWRDAERRVAWALLAIFILGAAIVRGLRLALPLDPFDRRRSVSPAGDSSAEETEEARIRPRREAPEGVRPVAGAAARRAALALVVGAGLAALALASGAGVSPTGVLFGGIAGAGLGLALSPRLDSLLVRAGRPWIFALGAAGALGLVGLDRLLISQVGRFDLAARMWPGVDGMALRAGVGAAALGLLLLVHGRPSVARPSVAGQRQLPSPAAWAWAALGALLVGAAAHDLAWAGTVLLAIAGGCAAVWVELRPLRPPATAAVLLVLAAGLGATGWEIAHREALEQAVQETLLEEMAPPTAAQRTALTGALDDYFSGVDLARLAPRDPDGLAREDLAFALWRRSPLARPNALSALLIQPVVGGPSVFAFGPQVATDEGPDPEDWVVARWEDLHLPAWDDTQEDGESTLRYAGVPWAVARYWILPRPGFSLGRGKAFESIELGLLRSRPPADQEVLGLPESVAYGLYNSEGRALISPWPESPPLPAELSSEAPGRQVVVTPAGRAWAWSRAGEDGVEVLYLPILEPVAALERVGAHAVGDLLAVALAAGLVLLLALPRPAFRDLLGRTLRSYSKRLMVVLTVLVLVPLLLFNLVVLSDAEERMLREQRASGEAALASAQRVIGDYVASLEPGFGFTTQVDDELLMWVSRVVHHQVNLYWGSSIWASSKPELFAAGLLPERIPGEIYSRLALLRYERAARTNVTGSTAHLEIYAPLRIPGGPVDQERLFLSIPLLAQQEQVAEELGLLRRRAMLVSAVLFGLLIAVGVALARRFSEPIEELVEGTRRIAAGAPSLDLAPRELELAALVDAVDAMARRIAESRERLVREKQVVERMVETITSGVVSLDREGRVLMHNRVARDLLGVAVGEPIDRVLCPPEEVEEAEGSEAPPAGAAPADRLAPVREFLEEIRRRGPGEHRPDRPERTTVRLSDPKEGDEREWSLVWVPVPGSGEPTALLVVEDATEVLRSQRLQAWAEMARIIAHEIKNPLTPLRLSTEHMREVYREGSDAFDEVFERCTRNILSQVEELRQIASEFSTFSSIPRIDPQSGDLVETMDELVESYRSAVSTGVEVVREGPLDELPARFDARVLTRAVRNLIENALRASRPGGRVEVRVEQSDGWGVISVRDQGVGVPPDLLPKIFDPSFSTHDTGTGLGLPIARRIAEEHGGTVVARNRAGGGIEVTIRIPL